MWEIISDLQSTTKKYTTIKEYVRNWMQFGLAIQMWCNASINDLCNFYFT